MRKLEIKGAEIMHLAVQDEIQRSDLQKAPAPRFLRSYPESFLGAARGGVGGEKWREKELEGGCL